MTVRWFLVALLVLSIFSITFGTISALGERRLECERNGGVMVRLYGQGYNCLAKSNFKT